MEFIQQQEITSVDSMTNEDGSFPKENSITEQPGQVAKATGTSTVMGFSCKGTACAIFNVTATTGKLSVFDLDVETVYNATDISIGSTNTIVRASGSWISDGFQVGALLGSKGFTTNANNNGFDFEIQSVTANTITLTTSPLTIESAGDDVTIFTIDSPVIDEQELKFIQYNSYSASFLANTDEYTRQYVEFDKEIVDCVLKLELTSTALIGNCAVGVVFAGFSYDLGPSQYGSSFAPQSFDVYTTTSSGALAQTERPRIENLIANVRSTLTQYKWLSLWLKNSATSASVFLLKNQDTFIGDMTRFGKIVTKPRPTWETPDGIEYQLQVREII